jgi:predicted nuclease of restriction endonuclease-like (RecB) superfamily
MIQNTEFEQIAQLISAAKNKAFYDVNRTLISLYWEIGNYISIKVKEGLWGKSVVKNLSEYLKKNLPSQNGFSAQNLWRMMQFFEAYSNDEKLSPLVREIGWTNNMLILAGTKTEEERAFYLRLAIREKYSKRELERQLESGLFERVALSKSIVLPEIFPEKDLRDYGFRDNYLVDFLNLPETFLEKDLRKAILQNLKKFILEFGKDFTFMGEEYRVQVGKDDFFVDLLFFHRELRCMVAFDLKIGRFKPEFVGKMDFYLEALDTDLKKEHENPSVGIVLCKEKDDEVVKYALSRSISPTMVAIYETKLFDKNLLRQKLHDFYELSNSQIE